MADRCLTWPFFRLVYLEENEMTKLPLNAAGLVIAVGCVLAVPHASGASVPLVNPSFADGQNGWSLSWANFPNNGAPGFTWGGAGPNDFGITARGVMYCYWNCPATGSSKLSQSVNLTQNHHYEVTYYAYNWSYYDTGYPGPSDPMNVQLGSQVSDPITVPNVTTLSGYNPAIFEKRVVDFTYTGPTGSAELSFIQNFSGITLGCIPCGNYPDGELLFLSGIQLDDKDAPGPGPGPVSEPSSLATLGLGLGALGLIYRRRRNPSA
jgi:hypothetical protein